MTADAITYSWRGASKKAPLMGALCLVVGIYIACVAIFRPHHLSEGRAIAAAVISVAFFAASLGLQFDQLITIDPKAGFVSRAMTFFGLLLWKSKWPLNEFSGVHAYRLKTSTPPSLDLVYVGLMRIDGRTLAVKHFQAGRGQPCLAADAFANELQCVVGAPAVA